MLEKRGIRVSRPSPIDFAQTVRTPDWEQASMFGCMPPRDVLITVGTEMLEATMCYRSRWFEYLAYRPVLQELYENDPDMRWEAAPKPRLTDDSYKAGFWDEYGAITNRSGWPGSPRTIWCSPRRSRSSTRPTSPGSARTCSCSCPWSRTARARTGCAGTFRTTGCTRSRSPTRTRCTSTRPGCRCGPAWSCTPASSSPNRS